MGGSGEPRRSRRLGSQTPDRVSHTDRDSVIPGEDGDEVGNQMGLAAADHHDRMTLRSKDFINKLNVLK